MTKPKPKGQRALILATLAVCAALLAWGTTAHLATRIFPLAMRVLSQGNAVASYSESADAGDDAWFNRRNIFGPETPDGEQPADDDTEALEQACDGSLRLLATVDAVHHPEQSLASVVSPGESARLVYIGDAIGRYQVTAVRQNEITLTQGDTTCTLMMFSNETLAPVRRSPEQVRAEPSPVAREGIQRLTHERFTVTRALINRVLARPSELAHARLVPVEDHGQVIGFQVFGTRAGSLLGQLGLENGDRVAAINGVAIDGPDRALELLGMLRTDDHWRVEVVRHQRALSLEYDIL